MAPTPTPVSSCLLHPLSHPWPNNMIKLRPVVMLLVVFYPELQVHAFMLSNKIETANK